MTLARLLQTVERSLGFARGDEQKESPSLAEFADQIAWKELPDKPI
jgi:hypothetical protein